MSSAEKNDTGQTAETLAGVLERIIFFNEENHYTIGELKPENGTGVITICGALPGVQCGETLELSGAWTTHREHGQQFRIASFKSKLPASVHGIRKYLGSGLVHGIGKTYAEKIVAHFGEKTLRIISESSGRLREIPGIGEQRAKSIKKAWDEQRALCDVMVFLQTYGVTVGQCLRLVKNYGTGARQILETEPYKVAKEIDGIGFHTADKIARNLGLPTEGSARIDAGVIFALGELEEAGNTAVPFEKLTEHSAKLLEVPFEKIQARVDALIADKQLVSATHNGTAWVQSPVQFRAEEEITNCVKRLLAHGDNFPPILVERAITWAQDRAGFAFADAQSEALRVALNNKMAILTGGPGTGKTTILSALCGILTAKKVRIVLTAPTGRAAQRMSETTRLHASTIHRLLKYDPEKGKFLHDAFNPINADILIVDETSMLDNRLAAALFRAIGATTHLLLVGDVNQLPSVGAGNVLKDLIASKKVPVITLNTVFRQGRRSHIVLTAHDILEGKIALPTPLADAAHIDTAGEFQFVAAMTPEICVAQVTALCKNFLPQKLGLNPRRDIQILAPMHKGTAGIQNLNFALQNALNPAGARGILVAGNCRFNKGDKVIQTRNNYDKGVFNGDLGEISGANLENGNLTIDFDGTAVEYGRNELNELQLAYAITIHKSQGSEFNTVVIPILKSHFVMLQRNLIYTAITRGKKRVILVGDPSAYAMAIRNTESAQRLTTLPFRLEKI